ncbi:ankyrin repeat domain-containing protein [Fluviicola sp.]|uniref:ankyrin repeat domain-containing protein n=1 Tax=Fluviicola sp. TaxID=1917219 RepID=UPI003D2CE3A5
MKQLLLSFLLIFSYSLFAQDDEDEPKSVEKTEVESPLVKAVRAKNLAEVKRLVEAGADVNEGNSPFDRNPNPLTISLSDNSQQIAKYLLSKGASSRAGLCDAIETGDVAWVQTLISYGFKCSDGVLNAVEANKPEMVSYLVSQGFNVNFSQKRRTGIFRKHYVSPMSAAISMNSNDMVYSLVKGGADIDVAFAYAVDEGQIKLGQQLIDLNQNRDQMFLSCFQSRSLILAKYCIQKGVDKNVVDKDGLNAYHYSLKAGYKEGIDYCIQELKLDPTKKTASNETPLMLACYSGNLLVFNEVFAAQKGTLEALDVEGETALFYAVRSGNLAIIEYLIAAGANVNHQNTVGNTVFMESVGKDRKDTYDFLKQSNPDLKLKNNKGQNIISFLMSSSLNSKEILELNDKGASLDVKSLSGETMAFYAMNTSNMDLLVRAKNSGANMDAYDASGLRPRTSNAEIIKFAVANGCNPNREDTWGDSYLTQALKDNQIDLALFLIRNGADVNWTKREGEPLVYMIVRRKNLAGLQVLVDNGVKLNTVNNKGESLMDVAIEEGDEGIVSYLKGKGALTKKELAELEIIRSKEILKLDQLIADKNMMEVLALLNKYPDIVLSKTQVGNLAILSVEKSNLPLLQRLIEKEGMNINQSLNFQEQNLLHIAAGTGNLDLIRLLINKGADSRKKDAYDKLPVDYAKSKEVKKFLKGI